MFNKEEMDKLVSAILNSKTCFVKELNIKDYLSTLAGDALEEEIYAEIGTCKSYIQKICKEREYYLKGEIEDCQQFIYEQIIKSYPKRYAYSNWQKVLKSIIKRKAIDFSKARNCDIRDIILESNLISDDEDHNDFIENCVADKIKGLSEEDLKDAIKQLKVIAVNNKFEDEEVRLFDCLLDNIDRGVYNIQVAIKQCNIKDFAKFTDKLNHIREAKALFLTLI